MKRQLELLNELISVRNDKRAAVKLASKLAKWIEHHAGPDGLQCLSFAIKDLEDQPYEYVPRRK